MICKIQIGLWDDIERFDKSDDATKINKAK